MDRIKVQVAHAHAFAPEEARKRVERLMDDLATKFPGYNLQRSWTDESRQRVTFSFSKEGKGQGGGSAQLGEGRVEVELEAMYNLPFLVPVVFAQKLVRDTVTKSLEDAFR